MSYLPSSRLYDHERGPERATERATDRERDREHRADPRDERAHERQRAEERERQERERHEREQSERERLEHERQEREREHQRERERVEHERLERERLEREHAEREREEHQRAERLRIVREREDRERSERERLERERLERLEREQHERDRLEREREFAREREREENERAERERLAHEREERERTERELAAREREESELERLAAASVLPPMAANTIEAPTPQTPVPPAPPMRPVLGAKEWLVSPAPLLHVEASESVTEPAAATEKPGKKRNLFHKAHTAVLKQFDRVKKKAKSAAASATARTTTSPAENTPTDPAEPDVLWFMVMCLGSICMGLMIWGAYSALPRFGNVRSPLRAELLTPRLKVTSDASPRWGHESHPAPPSVLVPGPPVVPLHPITTPFPPHDVRPPDFPEAYHPPHHELPAPFPPAFPNGFPPAAPKHDEPVVFMQANLGDSPMIRTWKKLTESTLLLAALTVAPVNPLLAQVPEKLPVDYSKDISDLRKDIKLLSELINGLKLDEKLAGVKTEINDKISKIKVDAPKGDNVEFQLLANRLDRMEKLLDAVVKNGGAAVVPQPVATSNLDAIKATLGNIEQAILKLQGSEKRIALSAPDATVPAAVKGSANIVFVNLWNQELTLFVNDKAFPVPPGHTYARSLPAGPTVIEVRSPTTGILHRASPTLREDETFALSAR